MDLLLILTYTAICVGIFKIFKIPLNKWTRPGITTSPPPSFPW